MKPAEALDNVWRSEAGSMRGALARRLGDLDRAEDALQDAMAQAMRRWPVDGVPQQPAGWLVTTAWRKAVDQLRREEVGRSKQALSVPIGIAAQAVSLAHQLEMLTPHEPEVTGLAVLIELSEARAQARFDTDGHLVLMPDQDRSRWDRPAIDAAARKLDRALLHRKPGRYQTAAPGRR